jgi:hypothetical protein
MALTSDVNETGDVSKVRIELLVVHRDYLARRDLIKVILAGLRFLLCMKFLFSLSPSLPVEFRYFERAEISRLGY